MNVCEQPLLPKLSSQCNSTNYCIEKNDWRPSQEILLTRFAPTEYSDKFRTINQDYGSFYYRPPVSSCIPDVLIEKTRRRQERFMNWFVEQTSHRQIPHECENNSLRQCNTETVKITHRKKLSSCHIDEIIIDFLVKQIQQRLQNLIDPSDYHDVFNCARVLITELLDKEPSLCAEEVINRVIGIMNTPFCSVNVGSNVINNNNNSSMTRRKSSKILTHEYYPITPPSSCFLPFSKPIDDC